MRDIISEITRYECPDTCIYKITKRIKSEHIVMCDIGKLPKGYKVYNKTKWRVDVKRIACPYYKTLRDLIIECKTK